MAFLQHLRQRAKIQRCRQTTDDTGVVSDDWFEVCTEVPCLLQKVNAENSNGTIATSARAYFGAEVDIKPDAGEQGADRVVVDGVVYAVVSVEPYAGFRLQMKLVGLQAL